MLLARRGITVTGVDIDPDALGFARQLLAKESDEVRERVKLVQGDFIGTRQVTGLFDTVVMGSYSTILTIQAQCWTGTGASPIRRTGRHYGSLRSASAPRQSPDLLPDGPDRFAQAKAGAGVAERRR